MSWAAAGAVIKDLMKSPWMKNQAPHVVVLFCILAMVGYDQFFVRPLEKAESLASEERLAERIQQGYDKQEDKQSKQIETVTTDNRKTVDRLLDHALNQNQQQKQTLNLGWDLNRAVVDLKRLAMKQEQPKDAMPTRGMRQPESGTGSGDAGGTGAGRGDGSDVPGGVLDAGGAVEHADDDGSPGGGDP